MSGASHYGRGGDDDDEEAEEEEVEVEEAGYKSQKDAVLFAIHVSESMLTKPTGGDANKPDTMLSPTLAALKCAYNLMQQRIISNPNDMMGLLLFGTEKSKFQGGDEGLQYPHCYLLTDLDVPAAADVKQLRSLVEDEEEAADLLVASDEEVSMANLLFCANQVFTTKAPNFSSRRLFLVTDNDYPHATNRDARNSAVVRAKDLYDLGVTIALFPISHPDRGYTFDRSRFYNDIVYSATPSDPDAPEPLTKDIKPAAAGADEDGISLLQSLISSVASRAAPRRVMFSNLPFDIGPGLRISVKGFILIKRQEPRRTNYIYLPPNSEKPQIVSSIGTLVADDTARTVEKTEVRRAYKFGGETISFTQEEMNKIKNFGDPLLRIIGFKPQSSLPIWAQIKQNYFIYPSEEDYVGSTRVFAALHQKLLKAGKFGLAWFIARRNAKSALVALLPGKEVREGGEQVMPPGIWIKHLPFADDIRNPPETEVVKAPDVLTDAMRVIVQQLQLPKAVYDPRKYPNPSLQWFYRILQALALEEDLPEKAEDKTLPRWKQIHKRAGQYVVDFGKILDEEFRKWQRENERQPKSTSKGAVKRSAPSGEGRAKKVKDEGGDGDTGISDQDMRAAYAKDAVNKYTVAQLKQWMAGKGIKGGTKKADVVEAVNSYFETKMEVD